MIGVIQMKPSNLKALKLIHHCGNSKGLTNLGNVLISQNVKDLLSLRLIDYSSSRKVGYKLTSHGLSVVSNG